MPTTEKPAAAGALPARAGSLQVHSHPLRALGWLGAALMLLAPAVVWSAPLPAGQAVRYTYTDTGYFANKPLHVYAYKASGAGQRAPVLILLHGQERQAKKLRDAWIDWADAQGAIVLAPEFDAARFPQRLYQLGNLADPDPGHWTFSIVGRLFEALRRDEPDVAPRFMLFGHSAGAQFVHRLMLWTPAPHVAVAVAANAGSYTWPTARTAAGASRTPAQASPPYTLTPDPERAPQLQAALQRRLVVMLGEADVQPDAANLPKAQAARQQGANRWERGHAFYAAAQQQAQALGVALNWQLVTVPGVGHDARAMGLAARPLLTLHAQP